MVKIWVYGTLTLSLLNMILSQNSTANTIWLSLENLFPDNKDVRAIERENELINMTLCDLTFAQYYQRIKTISDLLVNIENPIPEKTLVAYLLNGLSPQFEYIATLLRYWDLPPSFLQAHSKLLVERLNHPGAHAFN